jgi:hypothetical protein
MPRGWALCITMSREEEARKDEDKDISKDTTI